MRPLLFSCFASSSNVFIGHQKSPLHGTGVSLWKSSNTCLLTNNIEIKSIPLQAGTIISITYKDTCSSLRQEGFHCTKYNQMGRISVFKSFAKINLNLRNVGRINLRHVSHKIHHILRVMCIITVFFLFIWMFYFLAYVSPFLVTLAARRHRFL